MLEELALLDGGTISFLYSDESLLCAASKLDSRLFSRL